MFKKKVERSIRLFNPTPFHYLVTNSVYICYMYLYSPSNKSKDTNLQVYIHTCATTHIYTHPYSEDSRGEHPIV